MRRTAACDHRVYGAPVTEPEPVLDRRWPLWQVHSGLALLVACLLLSALSLVLLRVTPFEVLRDPASPVVQLLDVRAEQNVPTWFTVTVLALSAVGFALVGQLSRAGGLPRARWLAVAGLVALLSLDELAAVHERLEPLGRRLGGGEGALHFAWLVPGVLAVAVFLLLALRLVRSLPRPTARLFLAGTLLFVIAAVGLEFAGGAVLAVHGDGPAYILVSHTEELLETVAACLLLLAPLRAVRLDRPASGGILVTVEPAPPRG